MAPACSVLSGHKWYVTAVAFSPDGQTLASGSADETIKLWRMSDGACLHTLTGHTAGVTAVAVAPDGRTLASGSADATIKLWRVSDGACLLTLTGHTAGVTSVAFTPDGQTLASGSADETIKLWKVSNGACLQTFTGHSNGVTSVALTPDGQTLASGSADETIKLWHVSSGACLQTLTGDTAGVTSLAFTPDGQMLASGSADATIKCWRVSDGACLQTLLGYSPSPENPGVSVAISANGQALASGGGDGVALWQLALPLSALTLAVNPPSPQPVNTPITLAAAATGGMNVQYQCWAYNPSAAAAWSQLQSYSASATCTWTPSMPGCYLLSATAQDGNTGVEVNAMLWYTITASPLSAVAVTPSLASPQPSGTPITLIAAATGGANVSYQFWLYAPNAVPAWSQLQAFSLQNACSWTPSMPGIYLLAITACDGVTGAEVTTTLWYGIQGAPLTGVSLQLSSPSAPMVNLPVTLTAAATGGTNVRYQFWLYNPAASRPGASCKPILRRIPVAGSGHPGNYLLSITACDGITGVEVNTTIWDTVTGGPPLSAVSITASPPSPQPANTPITLTAMATGGTNVSYQFWLYNPAVVPAWSQLQAYSSLNTCTWTPSAPGPYLLSLTARDGVTGAEVNTTFWDTVQPIKPPPTPAGRRVSSEQ